MKFLRPEVRAALHRWREVIVAVVLGAIGLWVVARGGYFYLAVGVLVLMAAFAMLLGGWRRARFSRARLDPGVVQVVEGQVGYFGPHAGGVAALRELVELRLETDAEGRQVWLLEPAGGEVLAIPVAARGADALYDAFAALPGIDMAHLLRALDRRHGGAQVIWHRRTRPALT